MRSAGASDISSSISSRSGMPWSPIGGISGFSVSLLSSTAPVRSRAKPEPAALVEPERVDVVVRGHHPQQFAAGVEGTRAYGVHERRAHS